MAVAVTNLNPAGAGSLAAAVTAVDASTDDNNTITFAQGLTGSIPLNGELDLADTSNKAPNKSITITGPGSAVLTVSGPGGQLPPPFYSRDFYIANGINASISGLTVTRGNTNQHDPHSQGDGGGILNWGSLNLSDVVVTQNFSVGYGGGIANYGTLLTQSLVLSSNSASRDGGGLYNQGTADLDYSDQVYSNYTAGAKGGAGIFNDSNATLRMYGTSIHDNFMGWAGLNGGGIYNLGSLTMIGGAIQNNRATGGNGGGLYSDSSGSVNLSDVSITNGNSAAYGGGVYVWSGTVTCDHCTITGDTATVADSVASWNRAQGGVFNPINCTTNGTTGADPRY